MAVTEYKIARANDPAGMTSEVTAAIADGWQPSGPLTRDAQGGALLQALVKMSVEPEPEPE